MPPTAGTFGLGCRHSTDAQKSFVDYIKHIQADEDITGDALTALIKEDYPPLLMFQPGLASNSALIRKFAQFLESRQVTLAEHASDVLLNRIAATLYEGDSFELAIGAISDFQQQAFSPPAPSVPQVVQAPVPSQASTSSPPPAITVDKLSQYISQRFKTDESRFSGALGECWKEYLSEYQYAARELGLSPTQKGMLLHHLLRGNARRFYMRTIEGKDLAFHQITSAMETEFNSVSRQNRIAGYLRNLRINKYAGTTTNMNDALEKVHEEISKLTPQGPEHNRSETHRKEYLRDAVIGHSWAREACSRATAGQIGYQEFYAQLEAAIQLEQEEKIGRMRDQKSVQFDPFSGREPELQPPPGTFYAGQPRYGRDPRPGNRRYPPRQNHHRPKGIRCFGCGKQGHVIVRCPHRREALHKAADRVQYLRRTFGKDQNKALKRVLYEICEQIEASEEEEEELEPAEAFFAEEKEELDEEEDHGQQEDFEEEDISEQLFTNAVTQRNKAPSLTDCLEDF